MCGEWLSVKENLAYNKIVNCVLLSYSIVKCLRGGAKIYGIVTKIYLKYSYKFATLVPFKVLPVTGRSDPCNAPTAGNII